MPKLTDTFHDRCSFLTYSVLLGGQDEKTPLYTKMIQRRERGECPTWFDWNNARETFFAPLCNLTDSVYLFGNEWNSDEKHVLDLKIFVEMNFQKQGRYLICKSPYALIDSPLFWIGGNSCFVLIAVLTFDVSRLDAVLRIMMKHGYAGKMSPRYDRVFSKVNRFATKIVRQGNFSIISNGNEFELFFPI